MNNKDLNKQFDAFKRQVTDVVKDMHARKLAVPAAALLCAIVAALVLLPQAATPPPAPPTATTPVHTAKVARVAQVSLIEESSLDEDIPLTNSADPFAGSDTKYNCTKVGSNPKSYECQVADLKVRIICTGEGATGPCAGNDGTGSTSGTGASSSTGGSGGGSTGGTGGNGGGNSGGGSGGSKSAYYTVTVSIDGTTKKNVVAGDSLPKSAGALAVYAGTNDAHTKAVFIAADGVIPTGVPVDATFGSFSLKKGQTVTLTDASGAEHKMTLKSISKVTK